MKRSFIQRPLSKSTPSHRLSQKALFFVLGYLARCYASLKRAA